MGRSDRASRDSNVNDLILFTSYPCVNNEEMACRGGGWDHRKSRACAREGWSSLSVFSSPKPTMIICLPNLKRKKTQI